MLRVFKPTSPLSIGSYILSPFSALTVATAAVRLLTLEPVARVVTVLPKLAPFPGCASWMPWGRRCSAARWRPTPRC